MTPLPDFRFLSAPLGVVTALHLLTFTLHLLAMNILVGGLFFVAFLRRQNAVPAPGSSLEKLTRLLPTFLTSTVTLGVAPLLFLQLVYHQQVYSAAIVSAWYWLGIVAAVIGTYLFLYGAVLGKSPSPRYRLLPFAFVLLGYVSQVYSGVFAMAEHPARVAAVYAANATGTAFHPAPAEWLVRWLHMITGALAVGGLFVAWWTRDDAENAGRARNFFLVSMGAAMVAGFAYLGTLGEAVVPIMRSRVIWELTVSIVLALGATHFVMRRRHGWAAILVVASLAGMVSARHALRDIRLAGTFDPASLAVAPQWPVFAAFLVCLVAMVAALVFLIRSLGARADA